MAQIEFNGISGNNLLDGSGFAVTVVLRGLEGDDTLLGGSGADRLSGGVGHNLLNGGAGNDLFFVSPYATEFDTVIGGTGMDTLVVAINAAQYANPAIRAALSQLDYYIAHQAANPALHFVSDALHLDMVGVEATSVRIEAALAPINKVVPGAFAMFFDNMTQSYAGSDYTLVARWAVDGATFISGDTIATMERSWHVAGTADFNGDLKTDLLWQNATTGDVSVWTMDGNTFLHGQTVWTPPAGAGWKIAGTGDFNGDGRADILMATTVVDAHSGLAYADLKILQLAADGQTLTSQTPVVKAAAGWTVSGVGDFDGDGKSDLLWHNGAGKIAVWEMDGATFLRGDTVASVGSDWTVAGTGDFDGDGRSDILWRGADGSVAIWEMNGMLLKAGMTIANPGHDWNIAGIADHNGDGRSDILWRHAPIDGTGVTELQVWTMHGLEVASAATLAYVPNDWQTV